MTVGTHARRAALTVLLWACHAASALAGWDEGEAAWSAGRYEQAWVHLKPLAEAGDARAQNRIGIMLTDGQGVNRDPEQGFRWFGRAARSGLVRGQFNLGRSYLEGDGTAKDVAQALHWMGSAARQGDADAQVLFGYMHESGQGTGVDPAEAVRWYRKAAESGDPKGQTYLAVMYRLGSGVPADASMALFWLRRAAAQDHARAVYLLADMAEDGEGGAVDLKAAFEGYRRAAEMGHAQAQTMLGMAYLNGKGTERDVNLGVQWLRKAVDNGSLQGQFHLAWAYLDGEGVAQDARQACLLFQQNAQAGYAAGMREYGRRLEHGEGCAQDLEQARRWYERAAEAGDVRAMYHLGVLHDFGRGVPESKGHAVYWYVRAARLGQRDARNDLGVMYLEGEFVAKDPAMAAALFKLAAQGGQENGKLNGEKTEAHLDAASRKRVTALVEAMHEPAGFDAALNDSLAAAQGMPPANTSAASPASPCLPAPSVPTPEQLQAWYKDLHDRGPLWRITKDGRTSWLYGTLHVGRPNWLVPGPGITQALLASDVLAVESDLQGTSAQTAMSRARDRMVALSQPEQQAALDAALGAACASSLRQQQVPQVMQAMVLSLRDAAAERQHAAFGTEVLLTALARRRQMTVTELESPDETLMVLTEVFSYDNGARLQADLALGPERRMKILRRLSGDWEIGNVDDMERYQEWCECADDPTALLALQRLNDGRNPGMADRIDALHQQGQRVLAAVGAMHMTGPRGLPLLMAARGYQVERVVPQRPMPEPLGEIRVNMPETHTASRN